MVTSQGLLLAVCASQNHLLLENSSLEVLLFFSIFVGCMVETHRKAKQGDLQL